MGTSIRPNCIYPHETANCGRANTTNNKPHASNTKYYSIAHTRQPKQQPFDKQRENAITCDPSPREDGHVPNRCRCKRRARHTELSSRPCALRRGNAAHAAQQPNRQHRVQPASRVAAGAACLCRHRLTASAERCNRGGGRDGGGAVGHYQGRYLAICECTGVYDDVAQ